jgi:hypothetical protein
MCVHPDGRIDLPVEHQVKAFRRGHQAVLIPDSGTKLFCGGASLRFPCLRKGDLRSPREDEASVTREPTWTAPDTDKIGGWPEVPVMGSAVEDGEGASGDIEELDLENFSILALGEDSVMIDRGSDWQDCRVVEMNSITDPTCRRSLKTVSLKGTLILVRADREVAGGKQ